MNISLTKANEKDAQKILDMQIISFADLLNKYKDYDTSPGNENIDKILFRIRQKNSNYYLINYNEISIGAIRVVELENRKKCRISPVFIIPEYQGKGICQIVFKEIEKIYNPENGWELDTILEEEGNCYLYEKLGYKKTGKIEKIKEGMHIVYYEKR